MEILDNNKAGGADWWLVEMAGTQVLPERLLIVFISYYSVIDAVTSSPGVGLAETPGTRLVT